MVRVLDHAVDAPLFGRVIVVVEHLDGLLGGHVAAVRARVLDKEQLIGCVLLQTRQLVVVVPLLNEYRLEWLEICQKVQVLVRSSKKKREYLLGVTLTLLPGLEGNLESSVIGNVLP